MEVNTKIGLGTGLAVCALLSLTAVALADYTRTFRIEANGNKKKTQRVGDAYKLTLERQLSDTPCVNRRNFGLKNGVAWADDGCRGIFKAHYRSDRPGSGWNDNDDNDDSFWGGNTVRLESLRGEFKTKRIDRNARVTLKRKLSKEPCTKDVTWGYGEGTLWVRNGCRAEFTVRRR